MNKKMVLCAISILFISIFSGCESLPTKDANKIISKLEICSSGIEAPESIKAEILNELKTTGPVDAHLATAAFRKVILSDNTLGNEEKTRLYNSYSTCIAQGSKHTYVSVKVYFATDRNQTRSADVNSLFGDNRSNIKYGTLSISIPRGHQIGEIESPSIWRLQFKEDPEKHIVPLKSVINSKDEFFAQVAKVVRESKDNSAFIFVHGYNVTFMDAAKRTAQIAFDLGFDGAPTFYSWPSKGSTPSYTMDEQNIEWSQSNLKAFLDDYFSRSDAQNIYLIAHSMGNRALTRAVASLLTEKPSFSSRLKEIILTAPDIDADVFKRDIAPALVATGRPVTLYSSSEDYALIASKKVHGYPRAGDSGQGLIVLPGIETVDATNVDTSFLGHSYFADTRSVLNDIYYLITEGKRADFRFGLRPVDTSVGRYWEFKP